MVSAICTKKWPIDFVKKCSEAYWSFYIQNFIITSVSKTFVVNTVVIHYRVYYEFYETDVILKSVCRSYCASKPDSIGDSDASAASSGGN